MIELPTVSEILKEEFMEPMGISAYKLAKEIKVPTSRVQDILHGRCQITPDTSIRLGRYFGVSDRYFLNIQVDVKGGLKMSFYGEIKLYDYGGLILR